MPGATAPSRPPGAALGLLLGLAAAIRLAHWQAVRDLPFVASLVVDSAEYDRWARVLAAGDWLGSEPFFQAPLYPYLVALVYLVAPTPHAVYLLQIAAAVGGCFCLARATARLAGERAGLAAAGLAALYGPFVFHDVQLLKESLATAAVAALLWAAVAARDEGRGRNWLAAGAVGGLLVLLRENALLVVPWLAPLAWRRGDARGSAARTLLFALGLALPMVPVAMRNAAVGGGLLPTTYQGGVNLWIGNHPGADGTYRPLVAGRQVPERERREPWRLAEAEAGRPLTAQEVSRHWAGKVLAWARAEPAAFARLQLAKLGLYWRFDELPDAVDYYWVKARSPVLRAVALELPGLLLLAGAGAVVAWRRRLLGRLAPALVLACGWMVATVVFFLFSRYRLPGLLPLFALAALPLAAAAEVPAPGRFRALAAATLLAAAAWLLPRFDPPAPRLALVEQNLGLLAVGRGDSVAARGHFLAAAAAEPESFLPLAELGALAGRAGRPDEARRWLERAVAHEPEAVEAWANLGAAHLALGDLAAARAALERALALDPSQPAARRNLALLERRAAAAVPPP